MCNFTSNPDLSRYCGDWKDRNGEILGVCLALCRYLFRVDSLERAKQREGRRRWTVGGGRHLERRIHGKDDARDAAHNGGSAIAGGGNEVNIHLNNPHFIRQNWLLWNFLFSAGNKSVSEKSVSKKSVSDRNSQLSTTATGSGMGDKFVAHDGEFEFLGYQPPFYKLETKERTDEEIRKFFEDHDKVDNSRQIYLISASSIYRVTKHLEQNLPLTTKLKLCCQREVWLKLLGHPAAVLCFLCHSLGRIISLTHQASVVSCMTFIPNHLFSTGWHIRLCKTSHWLQNKSCVLA